MQWNRLMAGGLGFVALAFVGCGPSEKGAPVPPEDSPAQDGRGGTSDTSGAVPNHSDGLCRTLKPELGALQPLDKDLFVRTLGDSVVGWMRPLHLSLLSLDDARFLETIVEAVLGSFDTACKRSRDYEVLPPGNDLLDAGVESDAREAFVDLFTDAVVVPTGDPTQLRLAIHKCTRCDELLGAVPSYLTARLTEDGVLAVEYELSEGTPWAKHIYVTPNSFALEAELAPLAAWSDTATKAARAGRVRYPNASGKLSVLVSRTTNGRLSASVGVSGLSFETGSQRPVRVGSTTPCVGLYGEVDREGMTATLELHAGDLLVEVPGSSYCPKPSDCSAAERDGTFSYRAGDLSLTAEHPPTGGNSVARFNLAASGDSTMTAPGGTVGTFRLGHSPGKDSLSLDLFSTAEGVRVVFSKPFDARAAIAVSTLSDALRADLPDWLSDEIFDLTFGGEPKPSLLIPHRTACAVNQTSVYRRLVEVEAGTLHGVVGAGRDESATAGQCLGQTRRPAADLSFTSDWVEVLTCE